MILLSVLVDIVLPVFVIIALGFVAARMLAIDAHTLSRVSLYVLGPALVYSKLVETTVTSTDLVQIVLFTVVGTLLVLALSWVVARLLRLDQSKESGFMLSSSFNNSLGWERRRGGGWRSFADLSDDGLQGFGDGDDERDKAACDEGGEEGELGPVVGLVRHWPLCWCEYVRF